MAGGDERPGLALDAPVQRRAVELDVERVRADVRAQQQPVRGVVDELQVDVRVVDRRVAALRVVADVERVVRPLRDLQAGLVGGVEDRRRDLADAAAETGRDLAVDDHRRLAEALVGGAVAGGLVEREGRAGRDQLAVDEVRDELDVVDPVRVAAVDRLVAADARRDPHRLRLRGRAVRLRVGDDDAGRAGLRRERGGEDVAAGGRRRRRRARAWRARRRHGRTRAR